MFASRSCRWLDGFGCQPQLGALRRIQMNSAISSGGRHPVECRATRPWFGRDVAGKTRALQPEPPAPSQLQLIRTTCTTLGFRFVKHRSTSKCDARNFGARGVYKRDLLQRAKAVAETQSPARGCITRRGLRRRAPRSNTCLREHSEHQWRPSSRIPTCSHTHAGCLMPQTSLGYAKAVNSCRIT